MAESPPPPAPISPTVATRLAHRKRRHSVIDLTGDSDGEDETSRPKQNGSGGSTSTNGVNGNVSHPELDDEGDDNSLVEDILDTADLDPYNLDLNEEGEGLDRRQAAALRSRLQKVGPEQFIHETLTVASMSPQILGTAFGLDPRFFDQLGEDLYLHILGQAVVKTYCKRRKLLQYNTIDDVAALIKKSNNILVITGAGISTSLGIPDFRSKETGFYSKLQDMGITEPEEVFDIHEFDYDPSTFYTLAADILPDLKRYSPTHGFIRLLQDKEKLQTNYTQNIDNLEELAGIEKARIIQCHGSFATATCRKCKTKVKGTEIFADVRAKRVSRCKRCISDIAAASAQNSLAPPKPKRRKSSSSEDDDEDEDDDIPEPGVMKPDITFFGEALPSTFFDRLKDVDSQTVDLVLVIGTSLKVAPVSEIPNYLPHHVPHVYISREAVEHVNFDVQLLGDCDVVVAELARRAGWELRHEMLGEGLNVHVEVVDGCGERWTVQRKDNDAAEQGSANRSVTNGANGDAS